MTEHEDEGSQDPKRSLHGQDVSLLYLPPDGQVMFEKNLIPKLDPGPHGLVWKSRSLVWATEPPHHDVNSSSITMDLGHFLYHPVEPRFPNP